MDKKNPDISNFSRGTRPNGSRPKGIKISPHQIISTNLDMHIDKNGIWYYQGSPINRPKFVKLFASILQRDQAGSYWLITPTEVAPIKVEDAPFMATGFQVEGIHHSQVIQFVTNVGTSIVADKSHPLRVDLNNKTGEPSPYITLDHGIDAKINRATYYDLMMLGVEQKFGVENIFGVWSGGIFHKICNIDEF